MQKIPVIIDTDIGSDIDDTWALVMALGCPELNVRMIVTCTGDTEYRARIVCKLLEAAGRTDIPVALGPSFDEGKDRESQWSWVEDYSLDDYPGRVYREGITAMSEAIMTSAEKIALICIGPLPNIAALLDMTPSVTTRARFVGMHGAVYKGYFGTGEIHPEFNVIQHLKSARQVLSSDFDITITPLDTCGTIRLQGDDYQRAIAGGGNAMAAVLANYVVWLPNVKRPDELAQSESSVLFDTVAVYLAFSEELLEMQNLRIRVTDEGKTVVDPDGKMMRVATDWHDLQAFNRLLVDRLLAAG